MIDYFVVCHDQDIILNLRGKMKDCRFLFVGNKQHELIENFDDVVICKKLTHNIEKYPKLCSFTAWYAVSRNKLSKNKYSCMLEYDIEITKDFHAENLLRIKSESEAYGYLREPINDSMFTKATPWLDVFTIKNYNLDIDKFLKYHCGNQKFWYCTTNFLIKNEVLDAFNDWFYEMADGFKKESLGSYMHERMLNIYFILNHHKMDFIPDKLKHHQFCSHSNKDLYSLSKENQIDLANLYEKELRKCMCSVSMWAS
jgi:hypothetical protein